jgi:hypothetical protein
VLKDYYRSLATQEQTCIEVTFGRRETAIASAHQTIADLQKILSFADKQPEGFVYRSIMHDAGLAIHHAVVGLYRQSHASQRVLLESAIAALFYSAQLLDIKRWAAGALDVSWSRVSTSDDGVFSERFVSAFLPAAADMLEEYRRRAEVVFSELSDFVHKNIKTYSFDERAFTFDQAKFDGALRTFREVAELIAFAFSVRYLGTMQASEVERLTGSLDALAGNVPAFQRLIGGQAG